MCWQIGIDIGVSISIGADVYTNSDTLSGTVFSEAVPLFFFVFLRTGGADGAGY